MIGQVLSVEGKKYNVIILAGGSGTRMGEQSDYIPKALSEIGNRRAIDYIIERYIPVAHKFIIGTCKHADILETYVKGRYPLLSNERSIEFSRETELVNNAISTMYCLDHADTKYGTIITFCDLIIVGGELIDDDTISVASNTTKGVIGTFRHTAHYPRNAFEIGTHVTKHDTPVRLAAGQCGILGNFVLGNTKRLKSIVYTMNNPQDLTWDIISAYGVNYTITGYPTYIDDHTKFFSNITTKAVSTVYEFGTENDLQEVRRLWEDA